MRRTTSRFLAAAVSVMLLLSAGNAFGARPPKGAAPPSVPGAKKSARLKSLESLDSLQRSTATTAPKIDLSSLPTNEVRPGKQATPAARPDHLIVKFKASARAIDTEGLRSEIRGTTVKKFKNGAELVRLPKGSNVGTSIAMLKRSGKVEYAEPDYILSTQAITAPPNDPYYAPYLWGMKNTGQDILGTLGNPGVDIAAEPAWNVTTGNPSVVVAVIDTGVDFNHPELINRAWKNPGEIPDNGIDDDLNGYVDDVNGWDFWNGDNTVFDPFDGDQHGTHVSGTIAGEMNNNLGVVGVAPDVKIMSLKFIGPQGGYTSDAILALDYAASFHVKVANNSWGGDSYSQALADAIASSGLLFVAAAGNSAEDTDLYPHYPSSYTNPNVLSVAAVTNTGAMASFSNYGAQSVDVGAPGHRVLSSVPKRVAFPNAIQNDSGNFKSMYWGFDIADFAAGDATNLVNQTMAFFMNDAATPILVVEDDDSTSGNFPAVHPAIQAALAGYSNVTYKLVPAGADGPTFIDPTVNPVVIWATGKSFGAYASYRTLSANDVLTLSNYLHAGGHLLLTGDDAIYSNEYEPFVYQDLGVYWLDEGDSRKQVKGEADAAYDGSIYTFAKSAPYRDMVLVTPDHPTAKVAFTLYPVDENYDTAYAFYSGTSMATPHVTGVAALLFSLHPTWTAEQVKNQILNTAKPLPSLTGKTVTGGMVNAFRALTYAADNDVPGVPYPEWGKTIKDELDGTTYSDMDDVFRVHLLAGQKIKAQLHGDLGTDFDLYLYNPSTPTVNDVSHIVAASEGFTSDESFEYVAPVEGDYFVDVFGYQGTGAYNLTVEWGYGPGTYEENSQALTYYGAWSFTAPYAVTNTAGSGAKMRFYGDAIEIWGFKGPDMGLARITIDGVAQPDADLWAIAPTGTQLLFRSGPLAHGVEHQINFESKGVRSPFGKRTSISVNLDFINVLSDIMPPAAPTDLRGYPYSNRVRLIWPATNTEPDFWGWHIYRSPSFGGAAATRLTSEPVKGSAVSAADLAKLGIQTRGAGTSYVEWWDNSALNGSDYTYWITAVDMAGNESGPSNNVTVHPDTAPASVTGLGVTNGDGTINLYWTRNSIDSDVVRYELYRHAPTDPAGAYMPIGTRTQPPATESQVQFQDFGLTNEQPYDYLVYAVDSWGVYSETSAYIQAHPSAAPAMPTGFQGSATATGFHLWWNPNTEADLDHYMVFLETESNHLNKLGDTNTPSFDYATADFSHPYTFALWAVDKWGVPSNFAYVTVSPAAPAAPTGVAASAGENNVVLNWTPVTTPIPAASYNVYMSTTAGSPGSRVNTDPITGTAFAVTGLTNNQTYYFTVTAVAGTGEESPRSNEVSAKPVDLTPPNPPMGLNAQGGDSKVALWWNPNPETDLAGYRLFRSTASGVEGTLIADESTLGATMTNFTDYGVTNGNTYYYTLRAVDTSGNVSYGSGQVNARPLPPAPAAPTNLTGFAGDSSISLVWDAVSGAWSYSLYRSTSATSGFVFIKNLVDTSYNDTGLTNGTTYYYYVKAVDNFGQSSGESNHVSAQPSDMTPPNPPTGLSASAGDTTVTLTWAASTSSDAVGYRVLQGSSETGPWDVLNSNVSTTSYPVTGLTNGKTYWFKVQAVDAAGNPSTDSNIVHAMPNTGAVGAGKYENTSTAIKYGPTAWTLWSNVNTSGGNLHYSGTTDASASFVFVGTGIQWVTLKDKNAGITDIYLDGVLVATLDTYSSAYVWQYVAWSADGLTNGTHTLKLVRTGRKNPSASNAFTSIDFFLVTE